MQCWACKRPCWQVCIKKQDQIQETTTIPYPEMLFKGQKVTDFSVRGGGGGGGSGGSQSAATGAARSCVKRSDRPCAVKQAVDIALPEPSQEWKARKNSIQPKMKSSRQAFSISRGAD